MLDHFESDAVLCCGLGGLLARVSLIDVGQLDVLPGRFLYLLGELLELLSVVLVGRSDAQSEQVSQSVNRSMHFRALLVLVSIVAAPRAALGGRPQRARVHYGPLGSEVLSFESRRSTRKSWIISSNTPALSHRCVCW